MKKKVKNLLNEKIDIIPALSLLYLKNKMIIDNSKDYDSVNYQSFFCYQDFFNKETEDIENHFNLEIKKINIFNNKTINKLDSESLIDISSNTMSVGYIRINKNGINYLKDHYGIDDDKKLVDIVPLIINIQNSLSSEDKEFIKKLTEKNKLEKGFDISTKILSIISPFISPFLNK